MASIGHALFGLAAARAQQRAPSDARIARIVPWLVYPALALLPDLDVVAFAFGIPYTDPFGHRGASHAIVTGVVVGGLIGYLVGRRRGAVLGAIVMVSHGLFDTLTTGGEGVALLWPLSDARFFAPVRPIPVAPIGVGFLSVRGLYCVAVELVLFAPFVIYAARRR